MVSKYVNCEGVYSTEKFSTTLTLNEFFENYVEIEKMARYCSLCRNYGTSWECPPHTMNVEDYWKQFKNIKVLAVKLNYTHEFRSKSYTHEELNYIIKNTLYKERSILKKKLLELEKKFNGQYLYAGRCDLCDKCAKIDGKSCRFPELKRYSVESIGSNIQKATPDLFGFQLKWIQKDMKIPEYLVNVCAILY